MTRFNTSRIFTNAEHWRMGEKNRNKIRGNKYIE